MSLITDFSYIYTIVYPTHSLEDLQDLFKDLQQDIEFIKSRGRNSSCTCEMEHHPVQCWNHNKNGKYKVSFQIDHNDLCAYCQDTLKPFPSHMKAAGMTFLDHWHPRLLLIAAEHQEELMKDAIYCKEHHYEKLSNDELTKQIDQTYDYAKYLTRSEANFQGSDDEVPSGLLDAMEETDKEIDALEFEQKSRKMRGLLSSV